MNILITGGASGLGLEITKKLAGQKKHNIFFTYNSSSKSASKLESSFSNVKTIKCDFRNILNVDNLIDEISEMKIDGLINNALLPCELQKHFHKISPDVFLESFSNNIMPVIKITKKAISIFRKKKFGRIINILSSALISTPPVGMSEYVACKAYLASLSKSWASENAKFNITSNCISPSFMKARLTKDFDERIVEEMIKNTPSKKLVTPNEVSDAVLFLISCTEHINGINLIMNSASDVI